MLPGARYAKTAMTIVAVLVILGLLAGTCAAPAAM
jgi:hypothetical protein